MRALQRKGRTEMCKWIKLLLAVAIFSFASVSETSGAPIKLTVGYLTVSASFSPLFVTKEAGMFKKNGLDVELVFIPPRVLTQAMLAEEVSIGIAGPLAIEASLRGADFVILGSLGKTPGLGYLVTRNEITKVEELRGKRFGVSRLGAAPHRILELTLQKLNIDPKKDVTILQIGGSAVRLAAVKKGSIDGTLVSVELAFAAKKLGLNVLVDLRKIGIKYLTGTIVTSKRFIEKNEDTVRRFIKAMVEGIHYFKTHKEKSMAIMARYMRVQDSEVIEYGYDWAAEDTKRKPYVRIAGVEGVLKSIASRNPKAKQAKPEQFIDSRFVTELDRSGFIDNLYK